MLTELVKSRRRMSITTADETTTKATTKTTERLSRMRTKRRATV